MSDSALEIIVAWYRHHARSLPWRDAGTSPWGVLVSEVMLQQTPVSRVLPVFSAWMDRWPTPARLAAVPAGDAIRAWGPLGYPRRALRLHQAAQVCVARHEGNVPKTVAELCQLPGVGDYTAAAVASFAFGQRHAVLDTNVRRVYSRLLDGDAFEPHGAPTVAERGRARDLLPTDPQLAATTSVAVMELGALRCTARDPACSQCPVSTHCAWRAAGCPEWTGPKRRGQSYEGTDRQCRGRLLRLARESSEAVPEAELDSIWPDDEQRRRALASLVEDGLLVAHADTSGTRSYSLPR